MSRRRAASRTTLATALAAPPMAPWAIRAGYWPAASTAVLFMCAVVAVRIHEFFPASALIKPVLTLSIGGMTMLFVRSSPAVRKAVPNSLLAKLVFLYFGWVVLTVPFALYKGGAFDQVRALLPAILLFTAFLFTPPTRKNLDRLQFGYVMLVLFFAWYVQFFGSMLGGRLLSVSGSFDSNDIASIMAMAMPLSIGVFMRIKGVREKVGAALAIAALSLGVTATASRGGTLALVVGALVFVLGLRGSARFVVPVAMVVLGAIFWVTAPPKFRARMHTLTNLERDYNMTAESGRKAVWARARLYIRQNWVIGVGAGNFAVADGTWKKGEGLTGKWSSAHNAYLQAWAELGIFGGSIFPLMLLAAAAVAFQCWGPRRRYARSPPPDLYRPEFLASLAAFSAGAYFLSHAYFHPLYALLGLIALAERVRQAELRGTTDATKVTDIPPQPAITRGQRGGLAWYPAATLLPPAARGGLRFSPAAADPRHAPPLAGFGDDS